MTESLIDVCDAIRTVVLEPVPNGVVLDDTCAEPFFYEHNTLYVWASQGDDHRQSGDGMQDEERFMIRAAYALSDDGERASKLRQRAISQALDAKAHVYVERIRSYRTYPDTDPPPNRLWGDISAVVDHNSIRTVGTNAVRGFTITIRGWRMVGGGT